ncbi:hypothetical protein IQ22_03116 [Pseudomonas duriflava]|uniref:Uncharacterized protein n=1 Tax=Pseudomonas duriflava TaxID=459528 RepID=A0A562Q988_9PSED|nr:hypothetical protein [Pseudomonas duriflava]TWI52740.1 hypothetical protein IQ22_03116 [Pseudomonas duriflava]
MSEQEYQKSVNQPNGEKVLMKMEPDALYLLTFRDKPGAFACKFVAPDRLVWNGIDMTELAEEAYVQPFSSPLDKVLLSHFMMHAPAEPQAWFKPVMPPCPPEDWRSNDGEKRYDSMTNAMEACGSNGCQDMNRAARELWKEVEAKQRYVQWPRAWAQAQIDQLNQ